MEAEDENRTKKGNAKQATKETLVTIADDFNDVLSFFQSVAVKSPQFIASPLSLRVDNCARVWFCHWTDINLPPPPKPVLQEHMGLTSVLTDVAIKLHTTEAICPIVSAQREAEKDTKGWDHLSPTAQRIILATSATNAASHNPPLSQCKECHISLSQLFPKLCR